MEVKSQGKVFRKDSKEGTRGKNYEKDKKEEEKVERKN